MSFLQLTEHPGPRLHLRVPMLPVFELGAGSQLAESRGSASAERRKSLQTAIPSSTAVLCQDTEARSAWHFSQYQLSLGKLNVHRKL